MRKAVAVSGSYPCVRAGKITEAMDGWEHSCVSRGLPPQFSYAYSSVRALRSSTRAELVDEVLGTPGELIHVHNEPNWPVVAIKERDPRPLILNVHDIASARPDNPQDPNRLDEAEAYAAADGLVFVSEQQRDFAKACGFDVDKPYCILANWASDSTIVTRKLMPHIGGMVYAGGMDPRGMEGAWRDLSPVADAVGEQFHVYPGGPGIDYGTIHKMILDYSLLTHHMARHDWGFTGTPTVMPAWAHSVPNKLLELLVAGVPFVALNNPLCAPFAEAGYGIMAESLRDVKRVLSLDPKPYVKRIKPVQYQFCMRYHIQPLKDLYDEVCG